MNEQGPAKHTVTILPWLRLSRPVEADALLFWPFPAMKKEIDPKGHFDAQLQKIFSSYVDIKGNPIAELTVVSFPREAFKDLSPEEADRIGQLIRLLAFSVMSENEYYLQAGSYFNSTHFQHFHQRFQLGSDWIAPDARRREGRTLHGGFKHGELKFTMPLQALTNLEANPNIPLLDALVGFLKKETAEAAAIRQAIDWFFPANSDSDSVSPSIEVVMMGSAFESLLQVQGQIQKKAALMNKLPILFTSRLTEEAERKGLDGKKARKSWKVWWMDEFYWLRNKIAHGGRIDTGRMTWAIYEHLTIAALVLPIGVKLMLAQGGCYTLTSNDETVADSIDHFLAEGNLSERKLLDARWNASSASMENAAKKVLEQLGPGYE